MTAKQTRSMAVVSGGPVDSLQQGPLTFARDHVCALKEVIANEHVCISGEDDNRGHTAPAVAVDNVDNPHAGLASYGRRCRPLYISCFQGRFS